jgi:UDP-N-acetylmuramyl pentapeptide phosphotransferase/UDP-N-acetylglucosamine-1-phosphate transferase
MIICTNAFKWTAGSPGIIEANSLIIFLLIFILGVRFNSVFASTISIFMAGGLLIFLVFAMPPQKIMTGSAGKSVYGFMICLLSIIADAKFSTTVMLLIVPLIDFAYVIIKRYITYKPKNPLDLMKINGPDHFQHQLMALGIGRRNIVLLEAGITLFLGSFAILSTGAMRYFALILTTGLALILVVVMHILSSRKKKMEEKKKSPESKYSY